MPKRSAKSYKEAGKKAAATRKANALFEQRSARAKKGWATRRRNSAKYALKNYVKKAGGRNKTSSGKLQPYKVQKFGFTFDGSRYDFRGLPKKRHQEMLGLALNGAVGHYIRMLVATTSEAAYRRLTTSGGRDLAMHLARQKPGQPYWFWTSEYGPIASTLEAFEQITGVYTNEAEAGEVKVILVEVL